MEDDEVQRIRIEGVAAIIFTCVEMGESDDKIRSYLVGEMHRVGLDPREDGRTRQNMLMIAESIRTLPQPPDYPAQERERRRFVEDMVGILTAEDQLVAQIHARALVLEFAARLE